MMPTNSRADIVMLGTFAAWRAGTIQSRALPFARILNDHGLRVAIVTTPWDEPRSASQIDIVDGIPIINTAAVSPLQTPLAVSEQLQLVADLQPQAIHVIKPRGFGGLAAERMLHKRAAPKMVVDADDWEGDGGWNDAGGYPLLMQRLFTWQESRLLQRADFVIAASALIEARTRQLRADEGSVCYIPNGIESAWRQSLHTASMNQSLRRTNRILIYSRFQEFDSGWIDAFAKALEEQVSGQVEIMLVGATNRSRGVTRLSPSVALTNLGWVDRGKLPNTLASGSVAVFPLDDSLISRSKQSVKLIELMAAGCVVVASDVGEVRATIGDAGVALRRGSPAAFAVQVANLLNDHELRTNLSKQASTRARQFDIEVIARDLPDIYRRLGAGQS